MMLAATYQGGLWVWQRSNSGAQGSDFVDAAEPSMADSAGSADILGPRWSGRRTGRGRPWPLGWEERAESGVAAVRSSPRTTQTRKAREGPAISILDVLQDGGTTYQQQVASPG